MSTAEQDVIDPSLSGLLSGDTIARSIQTDVVERIQPEDLRERRFGYNPGFQIMMDPIFSGLQRALIDPGVLVLFETGPVSRQNFSVDPFDNSPPNRMGELLAGEGLNATYVQNAHLGFRELLPLRGKSDTAALRLFYAVHPPLNECVEAGLIPKCIYDLKVCITCRLKALEQMVSVPETVRDLRSGLIEAITVARSQMSSIWTNAVSEAAARKASTNAVGIQELRGNHFYFMQHLHERRPEDMDLLKIGLNAQAQGDNLKAAMGQISEQIAAAVQSGRTDTAELIAMREQIAQMQAQVAAMQPQNVAVPPTAAPEEPTTKGKK